MDVFRCREFCLLATVVCLYFIKEVSSIGLSSSPNTKISLNQNWTLVNHEKNITVDNVTLPNSVHTVLLNAGIISDPYSGYNDLKLRWIITDDNWILQKHFQLDLSNNTASLPLINLELDAVDTVATIYLNNRFILFAKNQFLKYEVFNLTSALRLNNESNFLQLKFKSSVNQAKSLADTYPYRVPLECPPAVQNGECHVNFLRKQQCSFSWDWGPAFAPIGINGNVSLNLIKSFDFTFYASVYPAQKRDLTSWTLDIDLNILNADLNSYSDVVVVRLEELAFEHSELVDSDSIGSRTSRKLKILIDKVDDANLWWPNGHGEQILFKLTIEIRRSGYQSVIKSKYIGFRSVTLVQSPLGEEDSEKHGLSFFFEINNTPIFLKGSNWIPANIFQESITPEYLSWLMWSASNANMNVLRVWGGGVYERSEFYELADRLGIMIWQDFMFACSMYPTNEEFLSNVRSEVEYQVNRLRAHPSIVVWSGNNENEAALSANWYNTSGDKDTYEADYRRLYLDVVREIVEGHDPEVSRPFLSSSPTNGLETMRENWIAKNPYDLLYGDLHFYNYSVNGWLPHSYPIPRFMSEFGVQSLPSYSTLAQVYSFPEDAFYFGQLNTHRQHHENGNEQILDEIKQNLNVPNRSNDPVKDLKNVIYLSQINQAMTLKTATELFRRSRNVYDRKTGAGHCMGTMYWQFNDVWQAPTWSSIEFMSAGGVSKGGKWKLAHYFIKNAYAPIILSPVLVDGNQLEIYAISDSKNDLNSSFTLELFSLKELSPKFSKAFQFRARAGESTKVLTLDVSAIVCQSESCFFQIDSDQKSANVGSRNFLFQNNRLDLGSLKKAPKIRFEVSETSEPGLFLVGLETDAVALFVYLDMNTTDFYGVFSDNGFHMTEAEQTVTYKTESSWKVCADDIVRNLIVKSLADVYFEL